ncbi:MAG: DUF1543 domain-containing protein [Bdellovibrionaceae bacterium]|jgi:hypothetical protein|nr:DUF1543 domain-containing protein [Pseudobdellovibrionaceae bacterium]
MGKLQDFKFKEEKLCMFYLGGRVQGCHIEVHDVIFLTGRSSEELKPKIKRKWFGISKSLHVDSWCAVEHVMGFDVLLTKEMPTSENKLYFVNLGAYKEGEFGEFHYIKLIVAKSAVDAKTLAKSQLREGLVEVHTDDIFDIDDCEEVKVESFNIELLQNDLATAQMKPVNGWLKL